MASSECPNAGPMLRCVVESVRSRCSRLVTRVLARVSSSALDSSRLASAFSNRIGLTLCGIVDEPVAPATGIWMKTPREMYVHTSVARLCSTRLNRATSAYSSACQSCDSICVVSGFQVRPRCSTNALLTAGQSAPGTATTCAPYVPVAPLSLPRYSSPADARAAGDAAGARARPAPCPASSASPAARASGRASAGRCSDRASSATWSTSAVAAGSQTSCTAPRTISAYERLLMSSLVHAKCTSSPTSRSADPSGAAASRLLRKYSTALTSCTVIFSIAASSATSSGPNVGDHVPQVRHVLVASAPGRPARPPFDVRWISHSTSTCTRSRFSAASVRWSTSGATAARYRPSSGPRAMCGVTSASRTRAGEVMEPSSQRGRIGTGGVPRTGP